MGRFSLYIAAGALIAVRGGDASGSWEDANNARRDLVLYMDEYRNSNREYPSYGTATDRIGCTRAEYFLAIMKCSMGGSDITREEYYTNVNAAVQRSNN